MADALQNYIDGKWVDAADGERFDVFNPATGEVIATAPDSKPADVDARGRRRAPDVRRRARGGRGPPSASGAAILLRAADIVRREHERLAQLGSLDCGQADRRGRARTSPRSRSCSSTTAGGRRRSTARSRTVGPDAMSLVVKEPMGVAARDHAVELPDDDGGAEGRAGDRGGLHRDPQARGADAAHRARDPEDPGGGGTSGRRAERADRVRRDRAARRWSRTRASTRSGSPARRRSASSSCGAAPTR